VHLQPAFVGRDTELEILARAREAARAGRPQVVLLVGEGGAGKTRRLEEAAERSRREGWIVCGGAGVGVDVAVPHAPIAGVLRSVQATAHWADDSTVA
jgi:hypothetical protein